MLLSDTKYSMSEAEIEMAAITFIVAGSETSKSSSCNVIRAISNADIVMCQPRR